MMPFDDFGDYFHDDENLPTINESEEPAEKPAAAPATTITSTADRFGCAGDCGCAEALEEDISGLWQ